MSATPSPHLEFAPPVPPGMGRAWLVAGVAHLALFLALGLATAWKTQPQTLQAEAELWSVMPQAAAPKLQETPPPQPEPEPETAPTPKPPKPTPEPEPDNSLSDAQIALEKKKLEDQKKKEAAERQRKALEKKKKETEEKAEKDKNAKDKALKEKAAQDKADKEKKELDKKKAAEKAKTDEKKRQQEQAKQDKANEARAEAMRQENLQRMQGMAGASGGPNATGTALKSSGPSATYAGRLVGRIKPNITYPGDVVGNPRAEVEVRVAPDGTITSRRIVQSSGNKAWDDAVLRAIDKTEILPKDTDGRVPPLIVLGFRPSD